jgi:hypothetical protein
MVAGLRALLSAILDYAGVFPPARLPLEKAVRSYARYRCDSDQWMLGRFVCPTDQLRALAPQLESDPEAPEQIDLSAVGRGGSLAEFAATFDADLEEVARFSSRASAPATVSAIEVRLPPGSVEAGPDHEANLIAAACATLQARDQRGLTPFFECSAGGNRRRRAAGTIDAIAGTRRSLWAKESAALPGFKLRCGGADPAAVPTLKEVAFVLTACREAGVPLKLTAGLHHPFRQAGKDGGAPTHGFINVFAAGVLSLAHGLAGESVEPILADETSEHFAFTDEGLSWSGLGATLEQITAARHKLVLSFGSCSFDEPRDDLRMLGLLS